jgi:hypothetical protein
MEGGGSWSEASLNKNMRPFQKNNEKEKKRVMFSFLYLFMHLKILLGARCGGTCL